MRDVYSKYWLTAREKKYGFMPYDAGLCELVRSKAPEGSKLFEVAIGTGYPVADYLQKAGYEIHGIDISPALIEKCHETNPAIHAQLGDAENLEFADAEFDGTYCFHSLWVIPDVKRVISEMLRVTRPGGAVLFDLQNAANPAIAEAHRQSVEKLRPGLGARLELYARNTAKVLLRRGNANWHAINYEVPALPSEIFDHLKSLGASDIEVYARNESDQSIARVDELGDLSEHQRLVVTCVRPTR